MDILPTIFDHYTSFFNNDMQKRAFNYSKVIRCLAYIDLFFDDIYIENDKKYIDIEDICTVEFSVESNLTEILIKNIYFNE
jgi:hypothetical protein